MIKQRLVVMNGQKIVETAQIDSDWKVDKIEKAGALKPGFYNLHTAKQADKNESHDGIVIHVNGDNVFQKTTSGLVKHNTQDIDKVPGSGIRAVIAYVEGLAQVTTTGLKQTRTLTR